MRRSESSRPSQRVRDAGVRSQLVRPSGVSHHRFEASSIAVLAGGLMSYSADRVDGFLQAASYLDPILRGTKPVDLPVQTPTNYELVINLTTR
jgi:hypothetical protein